MFAVLFAVSCSIFLFKKTCRDLAMFSDSLMITVTKAGIVFTGKGDTGSSTVTYAPSKCADDEEQVLFQPMFSTLIIISGYG